MKTKKLYVLLLLLCLYGAVSYGQNLVLDTAVKSGQLANGLRYYIRQNNSSAGYADFHLIQHVGSAQEEDQERGMAHFLEHMAFNGTKHFPGNTLVSTLEKRGIRFGSNINAATGYDHTIFRLTDIPVRTGSLLDTALLILFDWSSNITNNDNDIEAERGIIQEEWRTRTVANLRVLDTGIFPILYAGTPYADRIPIGRMKVVTTFKPQQLRDFFQKWYRPDLQTLVIVGNVNVGDVERKLQALFGTIPARRDSIIFKDTRIPDNGKPIVARATDPELQDIQLSIHWKLPEVTDREKKTDAYLRTDLKHKIIANLLANRFWRIIEEEKILYHTPTVLISNYQGLGSRPTLTINVSPKQKDSVDITQLLKQILTETERLKRYGIMEKEWRDLQQDLFGYLDRQNFQNQQEKGNFELGLKMIQSLTQQEPILDLEWKNNFDKRLYQELTVPELNQQLRLMLDTVNQAFVLTGPEKDRGRLPEATQIIQLLGDLKEENLVPYNYMKKPEKSLPPVRRKKGRVVRTRSQPFGFVEWTLSNGARVQYRQTDKKDDYHYIWAWSPGGMSVIKESDLPAALAMNSIINQEPPQLPEDKNEKINFKVDSYIETLGGRSRHIKSFLQLLHVRMSGLEKHPQVFQRYMDAKLKALDMKVDPKRIFQDTLNAIISNNNPRSMISLEDPKVLEQVDYDKIVRLYQERFGDAGDFNFFIAGPSFPDSMKIWVEQYIGSLPSSTKREEMQDHQAYPPHGLTKKQVSASMAIPQSTVTIGYTGMLEMNIYNQLMMDYLEGVLELTYTEKMREQEGGTYGVSVDAAIYNFPKGYFIFQLNFDTSPELKEKMMGIAYSEIKQLLENGPEERYMQKVKEGLLNRYQQEQVRTKNSEYWIDKAWMLQLYGLDARIDYEKLVKEVTQDNLQRFAKHVLGTGNRIEVVMDPK